VRIRTPRSCRITVENDDVGAFALGNGEEKALGRVGRADLLGCQCGDDQRGVLGCALELSAETFHVLGAGDEQDAVTLLFAGERIVGQSSAQHVPRNKDRHRPEEHRSRKQGRASEELRDGDDDDRHRGRTDRGERGRPARPRAVREPRAIRGEHQCGEEEDRPPEPARPGERVAVYGRVGSAEAEDEDRRSGGEDEGREPAHPWGIGSWTGETEPRLDQPRS
jgi:hypothetical protein